MRKIKDFKNNKRGVFWTMFVGVAVIFIATITWLVMIIVATQFVDTFSVFASPIAVSLGDTSILQGSIVIAVIDIGIVIWMIISAFKRESQEDALEMLN